MVGRGKGEEGVKRNSGQGNDLKCLSLLEIDRNVPDGSTSGPYNTTEVWRKE